MDLPEDVRKEIETSSAADIIMEIAGRLQGDGIRITHDVIAAINMSLSVSEGVVE